MSVAVFECSLGSEVDTEELGAQLARCVQAQGGGGYIELAGELGAGKTCLSRGLLKALGHTGRVKSPTYTVIECYSLVPPVLHMDLYRLADPLELEQLGLDEYPLTEHLWMVEWPERGEGWLPVPDLRVKLAYAGAGRRALLQASSPRGVSWLASLQQNIK